MGCSEVCVEEKHQLGKTTGLNPERKESTRELALVEHTCELDLVVDYCSNLPYHLSEEGRNIVT